VTAPMHQLGRYIAREENLMRGTSKKLCLKRITRKQAITRIAMNKDENRKQKFQFGKTLRR
jgi:hypothetical protein